jgi:hypothetical protein
MKRTRLFIHEPSINKVIGRELTLLLDDAASLVDAICEVDKIIRSKGGFPVPDYQSLLHMVYNPIENRFYKQVAITAYKQSGRTLSVRDDPTKDIPEGVTVTLIPAGGCISEWEEVVDYKKLLETP